MYKKVALGLITIFLVGLVAGAGYVYSYDARVADNLSAYCNIDFRSRFEPGTNRLAGATLELVDFRFSSQPLEPFCLLDVDGEIYRLEAQSAEFKPAPRTVGSFTGMDSLKNKSRILVPLPLPVLTAIEQAEQVKVSFRYAGSEAAVELPLSQPDLQYWKKQLQKETASNEYE